MFAFKNNKFCKIVIYNTVKKTYGKFFEFFYTWTMYYHVYRPYKLKLKNNYTIFKSVIKIIKFYTSNDDIKSCESFVNDVEVDGGDDETESLDLSRSSLIRRTAFTRSFAIRLHDSIFLCVNQQAAGPKPLMIFFIFY